jgi:Na+-translocating membrane potential-generating system (MpsC)
VSLLRAKLYRWGLGSNAQLQRLEVELERAQQRLSDATARYSSDRTNGRYAGATRAERNLVAAGKSDLVRIHRDALQRAIGPQLIAAVERLTDRTVRTFLSGTDEEGGCSIEAFLLETEPAATVPATLE